MLEVTFRKYRLILDYFVHLECLEYFWRNYKQPSYLTTMSFKVNGNFEGYRDQIVNNRTILKKGNIVHVVQRQNNKNKHITTIMSNITQKRYFLCNGPTGRLGNQLFDFASSLRIANTCKYVCHTIYPSTSKVVRH